MTTTGRESELRALLAEVSGCETAALDMDDDIVEALGIDSLTGLRLLAAVEKRFEVRFPDARLSDYRTLRALLGVVEIGGPS